MKYVYVAGPRLVAEDKEGLELLNKQLGSVCRDLVKAGFTPLCPYRLAFSTLSPTNIKQSQLELTIESYEHLIHICEAVLWPMFEGDSSTHYPHELEEGEFMGLPIIPQSHLEDWVSSSPTSTPTEFTHNPELLFNLHVELNRIKRVIMQKNHDYGDSNIRITGETGVAVRLSDKISRLLNLFGFKYTITESSFEPKGAETNFESVSDTWLDSIGYSVIGYLINKGLW